MPPVGGLMIDSRLFFTAKLTPCNYGSELALPARRTCAHFLEVFHSLLVQFPVGQ